MRLGFELGTRAPELAGAFLRRLPPATVAPDDATQLPLRAPATPFNAEITAARRYAFLDMSLAEVRAVGRDLGATVNDVVLALCAGALRRWLVEHEALPSDPLVAAVPVSVRRPRENLPFGNRLTLVRSPLPTDIDDPRARLRAVHAVTERARRRRKHRSSLLADAAEYAPPLVAEAGWWVSAQVMRRLNAWNLIIANVRGPSAPRYFAGARIVAHHPVSVLVHGQGLNLSVLSIAGRLCWGLLADPTLVPDLNRLAEHLADELNRLR